MKVLPALETVPERNVLPQVATLLSDLRAGHDGPPTGGWQMFEKPQRIAGLQVGNVALYHLRDVVYFPRSGLVLRNDRTLTAAPAAQVPAHDPDRRRLRRKMMDPSSFGNLPHRAKGLIWVSAGSRRNYGHFIFDSLTGLNALYSAGLTETFAPVNPRLQRWHHDLMAAANLNGLSEEINDWAVHFDELIYLSGLNHYLQASAGMLTDLARRIQEPNFATDPNAAVYLSRRGFYGRVMLNESRLETALAAQGVKILLPHLMSVQEQMAAMQSARVVIGPSGAALANIIFLAPGARLIELRLRNIVEPWLTLATVNLGLGHQVIMAESPLPRSEVPLHIQAMQLPRRLLNRYHFCYRVNIDEVLAALD